MAQKQTKTNKNNFTKHAVLSIIGMILMAVLVLGIILFFEHSKFKETESDNASDTNTASNILQTEEDLKDEEKVAESSNDAKDRFEADERTKTPVEKNSAGLNIAEPAISYVAKEDGFIVAGGAIYNINETEGTCTYIFTNGDKTVTANAGILPNASYISCEAIRLEQSKFSAGTWSVKIQYKSNTSEGESETQSVEI